MKNETTSLFLVRPASFNFNRQTAGSNSFQKATDENKNLVHQKALLEFESVRSKLISLGLNIHCANDTSSPEKPDAIFPNNWVSFHKKFNIIYPMQAENRRLEKNLDFINAINQKEIIDLSYYEKKNEFLEGTGSMIFDHHSKKIFACLSPRTHLQPLRKVAEILDYKIFSFNAENKEKSSIYHTNVMMCIAKQFVVICLESIPSEKQKDELHKIFLKTNKEIIEISIAQMNHFAGNMFEVFVKGKSNFIMSAAAFKSLNKTQIGKIEYFSKIEIFNIPTIEFFGGGSIRCMVAEMQ